MLPESKANTVSQRIESPEFTSVAATPLVAPDGLAPVADDAAPVTNLRYPLTNAAGLLSVTSTAWRVTPPPAFGIVGTAGEVRRSWSRGPRR
jgi:hypothetical protein